MYNTQEKIFIILFVISKLSMLVVASQLIWKSLELFAKVTYTIHKKRIIKNYKK